MRLLICAGGTGGGVYPALAVLQALNRHGTDVLWIGGEGGMESELVRRSGIPFKAIPAAGLHGVGLRALPRNATLMARGVIAARRALREFHPDVLLFTGGYVAFPMALAGRAVPSLVYVPDIEPGLALKSIARFSDVIAATAEESRQYFAQRARLVVTGYPTRPDLAKWDRAAARKALGLRDDLATVLVFGGSKGARSINQALLASLPAVLQRAQVVHVSGALDWPEVESRRSALTAEQSARYHAYPYLHDEMGAALAAADLAVSRSGASALGEFPLFGLPAVLVPYPHAWRYQKVNADYLASRGAAVVLADEQLHDGLLPAITALLEDTPRRESMRQAMLRLARPGAADAIAAELARLAERGRTSS